MKAVTFLYRLAPSSKFVKLALSHSLEFHLNPVELWLLIKLHGHQDGIFAPSLKEIDEAAKAEGEPGMPNIKTLEKAYSSLQDKGYVQKRKVSAGGCGAVWVRSVTMIPGVFPRGRNLLGPGAPTDAELAVEIVKFNSEQRRAEMVRQAYDRRARRERRQAGNVVEIDRFRHREVG